MNFPPRSHLDIQHHLWYQCLSNMYMDDASRWDFKATQRTYLAPLEDWQTQILVDGG